MTEAGCLAILAPPLQFANQEQINAHIFLEKLNEVRDYLQDNQISDSDIDGMLCGGCDGFGTVECPHCGQDMDCPKCGGRGDIDILDEDSELSIELLERILKDAMEIVASRENEESAL